MSTSGMISIDNKMGRSGLGGGGEQKDEDFCLGTDQKESFGIFMAALRLLRFLNQMQ